MSSINFALLNNKKVINCDLRLIDSFLGSEKQAIILPKNKSKMYQIIKQKLSKARISPQKRQEYCQWMQQKGFNLKPILKQNDKRIFLKQQLSKNKNKFGQKVKISLQPTLFNNENYILKIINKAQISLLHYSITNRQINKNHINHIINGLGINIPLKQSQQKFKFIQNPAIGYTFHRNLKKRQEYIKITRYIIQKQLQHIKNNQQYVNKKQKCSFLKQFINGLYSISQNKIFDIIYKQVQSCTYLILFGSFQQGLKALIKNSFKIVQQQFKKQIPLNKKSFDYYLYQKYLQKLKSGVDYIPSNQQGSIWAKIFILYRGGLIKQVQRYLKIADPEQNISSKINQFQQSFKQQKYICKKAKIQNLLQNLGKDIFRQQLLYSLGGKKKYSSDLLSDPLSLDCVWIFLRNTAVFYPQQKQSFYDIREKMVNFYRQNNLLIQSLFFGLYLLDYDSLLSFPQCQLFDRDDQMHFVLLMSFFSQYSNKTKLNSTIVQKAICYAYELLNEERNQYLYYLLLIPQNQFVDQISNFIINNKLFNKFDWNTFKKYRSDQNYKNILTIVTQRYAQVSQNYLEASLKLAYEIYQYQKAIKLLVTMFIQHLIQYKIHNGQQINQALIYFQQWMNQKSDLINHYQLLFKFIKFNFYLNKALVSRQSQTVQDLIKKNQFLHSNSIDYLTSIMLDKLIQTDQGKQLFVIFLINLSKAAQFSLSKKQNGKEMIKVKSQIAKTFKIIVTNQKYRCFKNTKNIPFLVQQMSKQDLQIYLQN